MNNRQSVHEVKQQAAISMRSMLKMHISQNKIIFDPNPGLMTNRLAIDRQNGKVYECKDKLEASLSISAIYGVLGILRIFNKPTLIFVEEAEVVGVIEDHVLYQVIRAGYLIIDNREAELVLDFQQRELIEHVCKFFSTSFYYSYGHDLTNQGRQFWWNYHMIKQFPEGWRLKAIQGYVGFYQTIFKSTKQISYFIITRRSQVRSGSIRSDTGLDNDGNSANYVETEQIILYSQFKAQFIIARGSPPLCWNKNLMNGQISINKEIEFQRKSILKHLMMLQSDYSKIICINLIDGLISNEIEKIISQNNVGYLKIPFEQICQDGQYHKLNQHVMGLPMDFSTKSNKQTTLFRINCLDSLDYTNIFMAKVALYVCSLVFQHFGIDYKHEFNCNDMLVEMDQPSIHSMHPFLVYFKQRWAENGESIAQLYRTTTPTNMVQFHKQLINDRINQVVIDHITNTINSQMANQLSQFENIMKKRNSEYIYLNDISIYVVTWNINAHNPSEQVDYSKLFDFQQHQPTFVAVGFQELVQLNTFNVVGNKNRDQVEHWRSIIASCLNNYVLVAHQVMVGCFVMVFVLKQESVHVQNTKTDTVKYGFGKLLGNKGGVIIKLRFYDSNICFINVHLPAGQKNNQDRLAAFDYVHSKINVDDYDWIVTFGDMNFRVNLPYQRVIESLQLYNSSSIKEHKEAILKQLKDNDQLRNEKHQSHYLRNYSERDITFAPTYKFDIGTELYDTVKKRVPSFTDRILLWKGQKIAVHTPIVYQCLKGNFKVSDHRPVSCYIQSQVCSVDEEKREAVFKQVVRLESDQATAQKYFRKKETVRNFNQYINTRPRVLQGKSRVSIDMSELNDVYNPFKH